MNSGLYTAFSGLIARYDTLNVIANNLANVNTNGYKEDRLFFKLYDNALRGNSGNQIENAINSGLTTESGAINLTNGITVQTGNNLDLALVGKGFFVIQTPNGVRYTRNGNLTIDSTSKLTNQDGLPVLGENGKPITLPNKHVDIDSQGNISQDATPLSKIKLVDFSNPSGLQKEGNSLFKLVDSSIKEITPGGLEVKQGFLEKSNVDPINTMIDMIEASRQFQFLTKSIEMLMTEVNLRVIDQVAKV